MENGSQKQEKSILVSEKTTYITIIILLVGLLLFTMLITPSIESKAQELCKETMEMMQRCTIQQEQIWEIQPLINISK